ncbi:AEC family transporter [Bombilactobacillus folatiphilus]|uniref:AEC family transporter n=1 Tax=Bombilactobacillus folatiphilus TaxID=2923362 RepID=A0ABY4P956_9LACO|nr:AEC family transporter [Bombilactobacillus folatiphilus]UQS82074.1 AEC family transporter [Bombilactobacillus folatiphilus]
MSAFSQVMLPILLIFLAGYLFQKFFQLNLKSLSTLAMYLLLPFLVFKVFYHQTLNHSFWEIIWTSVLIMIGLIILGLLVGFMGHFTKSKLNAFLLATVFPNSGNYGVPLVLFAFGNKGSNYAMMIMVFHNILMGLVGVFIAASSHQHGIQGLKTAVLAILKQPMNYVILPAILLHYYHILLPVNLMKSVNMLSNITIPLIMLILGMQLADVKMTKISPITIILAVSARLLLSPLLAWLVCSWLSVGKLLTQIIILMAAMPSAANTTLYAIQFETEPDLVSSCTLMSTLLSVGTLTVLLNLVG